VPDTPIDLGRPIQGDVVDMILDDHRRFEALLRDLRNSASDRDAVRRALARLHTAHAIAEETHVYPRLERKHAITEHDAEHGEHEHAEGHEAMLAVLESERTDTEAFDDAVEELARVLNHHLTEEELTILNPAREEVEVELRNELGEAFATERNQRIDAGCGTVDEIRDLVDEARREGLLDEDAEEGQPEG
jgi:hemerythrin superfamily protein